MLVFTRNISQRFWISDNITVTILDINGLQVKIGIDAPREIPVHREEIYQRILNEKRAELL